MIHRRVKFLALRRASDLYLEASMALEAGLHDTADDIAARARITADQAARVDALTDRQQLTLPLEYRCATP